MGRPVGGSHSPGQHYAPTHCFVTSFSSQRGTWGAVPLSEVGGGLGGTESKTGWHPNFCAP